MSWRDTAPPRDSDSRSEQLIEQASELYAQDRISLDQLERATDAALTGDRDRYFAETGLDSYAWRAPVPLPPPSGINVRERR